MFQSCGYFTGVPCPFFLNGLCERPYCHFRHSRHDVARAKENVAVYSTEAPTYSPTPINSITTRVSAASEPSVPGVTGTEEYYTTASNDSPPTLSKVELAVSIPSFTSCSKYDVPVADEEESYTTASPEKAKDMVAASSRSPVAKGLEKEAATLPSYLPTPKTPSLPVVLPAEDDSGIPVYQPTPKLELKKNPYTDDDQSDRKARKRKGTDLEYDPACNFSCKGLNNSSSLSSGLSEKSLSKKAKQTHKPIDPSSLGCLDVEVESEDEAEPVGEFSADEDEDVTAKTSDSTTSSQSQRGNKASDDFENICDDDISSDDESDELLDVPDLSLSADDLLKLRLSLKSEITKSSKRKDKKQKIGKDGKWTMDTSKADKPGSVNKNEPRRSSKDTRKVERQSSTEKSKEKKLSKVDDKKEKTVSGIKSESIILSSKDNRKLEEKSSAEKSNQRRSSEDSKSSTGTSHKPTVKQSNTKSSPNLKTDRAGELAVSSLKSDESHQKDFSSFKEKEGIKTISTEQKIKGSTGSSSVSKTSSSHSGKHNSATGKSSSKSSLQLSEHGNAKRKISDDGEGSSQKRCRSETAASDGDRSGSGGITLAGDKGNRDSQQSILKLSHSSKLAKSSSHHKGSSGSSKSLSQRVESIESSLRKSSSSSSIKAHSKDKSSHSVSSSSKHKSSDRVTDSGSTSPRGSAAQRKSSSGTTGTSSRGSASQRKSSSGSASPRGSVSKLDHKGEKAQGKSGIKEEINQQVLKLVTSDLFGEEESDGDHGEEQVNNLGAERKTKDDGLSANFRGKSDVDSSPFRDPVMEGSKDEFEPNIDYSTFIHDSDLEDEDTFDECLRIFKEDLPQDKSILPVKKINNQKESSQDGISLPALGKKRTAHTAAEQKRKPELVKKEKPRHMLSPMEVMHNRILEMQRRALERAARQAVQEQEVSSTSSASSASAKTQAASLGEKKRVAHLPTKPAKATTSTGDNVVGQEGSPQKTLAITASKTDKRVAHTSNLPNLKRPVIPGSFGSKVPSNIRQRYLNLIIDECLKFLGEEQAYKKGLAEEAGVYERSSNKNIYLRVAVNAITRLRAEAKEAQPGPSRSLGERRSSLTLAQSHLATLGGSRAAKTSFTLHRSTGSGKKVEVPLTVAEVYQKLLKYAMTDEQIVANGYPRPSPEAAGRAVILDTRYQDKDSLLKPNERTCSRCGKRFIVNSDGTYAFPQECIYHWSRAYPRRKNGYVQNIYNCCSSDASSLGCQVAPNHVHEQNKREVLTGFMQTMPRSPPKDGNYGIYALDCEMVYTLGGLELARVTVVDVEGETVFESLVHPLNRIVDYNTRFSGLTEADLKNVDTTLTDVQAILLARFSANTILIGHSLESDFFALKLIHSTVVDTSVVFPHRLGPPYKRALKNLMLETFQKLIQCDDGGHDSKEDAVACLQLMKWKLREDSKRENRYT